MSTLRAHAVLTHHNNVRRMQWHPTQRDLLLLDCNDNIAFLYHASSDQPPIPIEATLSVTPLFTFAPSKSETAKPVVLAATRTAFTLIYPEGREEVSEAMRSASSDNGDVEDSLFEVLTGRTPAPAKTAPSYTEQLDMSVDMDGGSARMDDTFREKHKEESSRLSPDPLDDSQIF